jgi:hypothetical protein
MADMDKEIMMGGNAKVPDFIAAKDASEIKMKIVQLCAQEIEEIFLIRVGIGSSIKEASTFLSLERDGICNPVLTFGSSLRN